MNTITVSLPETISFRTRYADRDFTANLSWLPNEIIVRLIEHGMKQKIDDTMAGARTHMGVLVRDNKADKRGFTEVTDDEGNVCRDGLDVARGFTIRWAAGNWNKANRKSPASVVDAKAKFVRTKLEEVAILRIKQGLITLGGVKITKATAGTVKIVADAYAKRPEMVAEYEAMYVPVTVTDAEMEDFGIDIEDASTGSAEPVEA